MSDMAPTLRRGTVDDARQIADHNVAMAKETESLVLDDATCLEGCRAILGDGSKGFYTVAVEDGRVVGQLMITYEWSDWRNRTTWWIQSVYVVPDRRGRGIFTALYGHVRRLCEEEGGAGLRLYADDSNVKAQAVYAKLGMVRVFVCLFVCLWCLVCSRLVLGDGASGASSVTKGRRQRWYLTTDGGRASEASSVNGGDGRSSGDRVAISGPCSLARSLARSITRQSDRQQ